MADTVLQVVGFQSVARPQLLWKPDRRSKSVMEIGAANALRPYRWAKSVMEIGDGKWLMAGMRR